MRILWVKTSSLGDVVHGLYAIQALHLAFPGLEIDAVVEEEYAALPRLHPGVRQVLPLRWRDYLRKPWDRQARSSLAEFDDRLRAHGPYDALVDAQGLIKSALLVLRIRRCVAVQRVIGYDRHSVREPLASWFYNERIQAGRDWHAIERMCALYSAVLGGEVATVDHSGLERTATSPAGDILLLHGASDSRKTYPREWWVALARLLKQQGHSLATVWGSAREREVAEALVAEGAVSWGRLPLDELMRRAAGVRGYIGVDSGPSHLSAALAVRGVMLYRRTQPELTAPRQPHSSVLCVDDESMDGQAQVVQALEKLLV